MLETEPMQLLEVLDVAKALGVSSATVRRLADEGKLGQAATTPRGQRLFDLAAVERLRQERAATPGGMRERRARFGRARLGGVETVSPPGGLRPRLPFSRGIR